MNKPLNELHSNIILLFLPGAPVKYWQRMCLSVKNPIFERNDILLLEQEVEILETMKSAPKKPKFRGQTQTTQERERERTYVSAKKKLSKISEVSREGQHFEGF